jgi:DegV family protein with EDD domain
MVRVVTESTSDIPPDMADQLGITVVPSYVVFGSETYRDGVELTKQEFYERLEATHEIPTTATPPPSVYEEAYRQLARETDAIVSIHAAARLSSLYDVASLAAQNISEARITVIDSGQVSMGYGWMAVAAAEAAQQGKSLTQIVTLVESMKDRTHLFAVLDTLNFVYRGGRVGWVEALLGTLMRIKPIVDVWQGEVKLLERTRTWTRSLDRLIERVQALGPLERAMVLHANAQKEAEQLADRLQSIAPNWRRLVGHAGVTIASHTGPGAVGIACTAGH